MSGNPKKVGYGSPPLETRFRKGKSGNPAGGRKKRHRDMDALFSGDEEVVQNGKKIVVSAFEAERWAIARRAIEGNSFKHQKRLVDLLLKHGAIVKRQTKNRSGVVVTPHLPGVLIELLVDRHGLPVDGQGVQKWTSEQIAELRPQWLAVRDELNVLLDDMGYWRW